ncbi:MAG: iron uptake porin [Prochlorothrix sp.]
MRCIARPLPSIAASPILSIFLGVGGSVGLLPIATAQVAPTLAPDQRTPDQGTPAPTAPDAADPLDPLQAQDPLQAGLLQPGLTPPQSMQLDPSAPGNPSAPTQAHRLDSLLHSPAQPETLLPPDLFSDLLLLTPPTQQPAVHQLQPITPDHWAAQALTDLADRYNCPDPSSIWPDRAYLSRSDFATLVDRCLQHFQDTHPLFQSANGDGPYFSRTRTTATDANGPSNRGILELEQGASGQNANSPESSIFDPAFAEVHGSDLASPDLDFVTLQRLQTEFARELNVLGDRIDGAEERIQTLEDQQFSERTKLFGTASFSTVMVWGSQRARANNTQAAEEIRYKLPFGGNVSLGLDTRFRRQDLLRLQLGAGGTANTGRPFTGTTMSTVPLGANTGDENQEGASLVLQSLWYQSRWADRGLVRFGPAGISTTPLAGDLNPVNSTSAFGKRNPLHLIAGGGGVAANYRFNDRLSAAASYTSGANTISDPDAGLFLGRYSLFGQLLFTPHQRVGLSLSHVYHANPGQRVNLTAGRGSALAQAPFGNATPTMAHLLGLEMEADLTRRWTLGTWVGYNWAWSTGSGTIGRRPVDSGASATSWNWAFTLNRQDFGNRGSQLGFVVGMPPKAVSNSISGRTDPDTTYHLEVLYRYRHNSRLQFTPGLILLLNPEHNANNPAIWVGSLSTVLRF